MKPPVDVVPRRGRAVTPHGMKVCQGQERARARGARIGRPTNPRLTPTRFSTLRKRGDEPVSIAARKRIARKETR